VFLKNDYPLLIYYVNSVFSYTLWYNYEDSLEEEFNFSWHKVVIILGFLKIDSLKYKSKVFYGFLEEMLGYLIKNQKNNTSIIVYIEEEAFYSYYIFDKVLDE